MKNTTLNKFAEKLTELMQEKNISQAQLANMLELTQQTISNYKLGVSEPDLDNLIRIAVILDCNVNELLGFEEVAAEIQKR